MTAFYYERKKDENKTPYITVCVAYMGKGRVSRGTAYCSPTDICSKAVGRQLARDRMLDALRFGAENGDYIVRAKGVGDNRILSSYNTAMTETERRIFAAMEAKHD